MTSSLHCLVRRSALALVLLMLAVAGSVAAQERSQVPDGQGGVTLLDAGMQATCGIRPDGTALCWGSNSGRVAAPPRESFVEISIGGMACGLRADGTVICWGNNGDLVPAGETFRTVAAGMNFACGLTTAGAPLCWGDNQYGQATAPAGETFVALTAGQMFACGLRADGSARCWGYNADGQASAPIGAGFVALTAGAFHACGLRADGSAQCWGSNASGQGTMPVGQAFVSLTAGDVHTCGLRADGVALCWGYNFAGSTTVPAGQTFVALSAGGSHTCGLRANGVPLCWGDNQSGQRGITIDEPITGFAVGDSFGCAIRRLNGAPICWGLTNYNQSVPPAGEQMLVQIVAGGAHACALRSNRTAICWGRNDFGQATAPTGQVFTQLAAGARHTCGRRNDGTLLCWGDNAMGQATAPAGTFQQLDAGLEHTCAVKADGTAVCWGSNASGQTTVPASATFSRITTGSYFSCGVRTNGALTCWGGVPGGMPTGTFFDVSAGSGHACAQRNDATVQCWGNNQFGQAVAPAGTFVFPIDAGGAQSCAKRPGGTDLLVCWGELPLPDGVTGPYGVGNLAPGWQHSCSRGAAATACWGDNAEGQATVPAGTFTELDVGERNTCALTAAGTVQCWGRNVEAQGTPPTGPFKALRMAPYGGCALRPTGTIACWGLNNYGQVTPPAGTYRAVDAGYFHGCAINSAAAAVCWGLNTEGQATPPAGMFRDIAIGDYHSCGLRMDGSLACWGRNADGQSTAPAGAFVAFALGRFHGCAIGTGGGITCWGANDAGQSTPPSIGHYLSVSAGMSHSCAIRDDGVRVCWGSNAAGANPDLVLSPASLPGGMHGTAYTATQFTVAGANYTPSTAAYGVVAGALPPGMTLSYSGSLSGTPTAVGSYMFTVEGEDANGFVGSRAYTIVIADPTPPVITPTVSGTLGDNGWYRSDVEISWSVSDAQSAITSSTGCNASTLSTDSPGAGYTCTATSGGGTSSQTATVKRDATQPAISSVASTFANAGGWYNAAVTLAYTCTDATSGVASCPADDTVSTEGSGVLSPARSATDVAGNTRAVTQRALNIDTTAPVAAIDSAPPAQSDSADATFAFSATDALSGIDALECSLDGAAFASCASPLALTALADGAHAFAVRARDVAGNVDATPATHAWTIDTDDTPPVIAPVVSGTLGDNGWYVGDVTIGWNVSDADSSIGSSTGCNTVVLSTDTAGATFTCTASSVGGTASETVMVKLDKTAPQITAATTTAPNAAGWYRDDVAVAYTCSDALSGVVACPSAQVLTGEGAAVASVPRTVTDAAGNTSAPVSVAVKIDRTAPMLAPSVAQPLLLHADSAAQANATDALSGIDAQSCSALATGSIGAKSVNCTATDIAGNTASVSANYRVSYGFAGFEAPLEAALNGVKPKKYLPFKWRVFDANNADVSGLSVFNVSRTTVACPAGVTPVPVAAYGTSNIALQYLGGGRYQRNWSMPVWLAGSCVRIDVELGDGVKHALMVKLL